MNFDSLLLRARRYVIAAWRRRLLAVIVAWFVCLAGWAGVASLPNRFESTARIQADADAMLTPVLSNLGASNATANTVELLQKTLLSTPNVLDIIHSVDQLNMMVSSDADRDALVTLLSNQIKISPQRRDLFSITYSNRDPLVAQTVVEVVVKKFEAAATKANMSMMQNSTRFINEQIAKIEARLQDIEREMTQFQVDHVDLLPGLNGAASKLDVVKELVPRLRGDLQDAGVKHDIILRQLASTPEMLSAAQIGGFYGGGGGRGYGMSPLQNARQELDEVRARFSDDNPSVIMMRAKVAALEKSEREAPKPTAQTPGNVPNPLYQHLKETLIENEFQISSLNRQLKTALETLATLEVSAKEVPLLQAKSVQMQRDYAALKSQRENLVHQRETISVSNDAQLTAQQTHIEVVDPPSFAFFPIWPPRKLFVAVVLVLGFASGAAAAVGRSYLDTSCYTTIDLQHRLQFDVLGQLSSAVARQKVGLLHNSFVLVASVLLVGACVSLEVTSSWTRLM